MKRIIHIALGILIVIFGVIIFYFGYRWHAHKSTPSNKIERTLALIKPDAVSNHATGKIIDQIEQAGFTIIDLRKVHLDREQAEKFYAIHHGKKFFHQLVDFIVSGPLVALVLEKINAVVDWRNLMGETDPAKAKEGTIRKQFGTDIGKNAVHGSDSQEAALNEVRFFFSDRA